MNNFGVAREESSKFSKNPIYIADCPGGGDRKYRYMMQRQCIGFKTLRCIDCQTLRNQRRVEGLQIPTAKVSDDGTWITDPSNPHIPHFCVAQDRVSVEVVQLKRKANAEAREGKKPRAAHDDLLVDVLDQFADDPDLRDAIERELVYSKARSAMYKQYAKTFMTVNSIDAIPRSLLVTLAGSKALARGDPVPPEEQLVVFQQRDPPLVVFACKQDLQVLHQSGDWFMDGTFKYRPVDLGFAQLYIIFGLVNRESAPAVHALTADKQEATYTQLLILVRQMIIQNFGNVGALHSIHCDFETAAINSSLTVFPQVVFIHFYVL